MPKKVARQNENIGNDAKNNQCECGKANSTCDGEVEAPYQRRPKCCILDGDTDVGGLLILIPVLGFTIGIALRTLAATG